MDKAFVPVHAVLLPALVFFCLALTRIVYDVILHVVRQPVSGVYPLLQLSVRDVPRHHHGAREAEPRSDRVAAQDLPDLVHGLIQIYLHHLWFYNQRKGGRNLPHAALGEPSLLVQICVNCLLPLPSN